MQTIIKSSILLSLVLVFSSCDEDLSNTTTIIESTPGEETEIPITEMSDVERIFDGNIKWNALLNYENQAIPLYIQKDNTGSNDINDETATLGRILFYDKKLSVDNSVSCASCHKQEFAFGDNLPVSTGINGQTGRHSMRLINARFANERRFFWDERANSLEEQTTMPIQDHAEMGFSGQNGDPDFQDLVDKLSDEAYYVESFTAAFGDPLIDENRIQDALAQFIRSIQSFDSKYDEGRAAVNNPNQNFPNYSALENRGKQLFQQGPIFQGQGGNRIAGGLGCQGCHRAPEFDIDPNSRNNGVINTANDPQGRDLTVTRSPSLRDIFNHDGNLNGPLMHTGTFGDINMVVEHYDMIIANGNNNLDRRLSRGNGQRLNITPEEREALIAFLRTLSGRDVYTNEKWSNPFIQ